MKQTISMLGAWTALWLVVLSVITFDINPVQIVHAEEVDQTVEETTPSFDSNTLQTSATTEETEEEEETPTFGTNPLEESTIDEEETPTFGTNPLEDTTTEEEEETPTFGTNPLEDTKATNTPPTISLNGDASVTITKGQTFSDQGASASDTEDGDLTSSIVVTGTVDTTTVGTYTLTYTVTDSDGASASVTRTVVVEETTSSSKSSHRRGGGGGSSRGEVLGATTGPVLDESCGIYLNEYLRLGAQNNPAEVIKLQIFLNEFIDADIAVTGTFDLATDVAVKELQTRYAEEILEPWTEAGFGPTDATGYVYITTRHFINVKKCEDLNLVRPELRLDTSLMIGYLPATAGRVLGASTVDTNDQTCGIYLHDQLVKGANNNPQEVMKLQHFLNEFMNADLAESGYFGDDTENAVRRLQAEYQDAILKPWIDAGRVETLSPTGIVGESTLHFINSKMCPVLDIELEL